MVSRRFAIVMISFDSQGRFAKPYPSGLHISRYNIYNYNPILIFPKEDTLSCSKGSTIL